MKIVKVQYTVKTDYVEKNKENIFQVMKDLRKLNNTGIRYSVFMAEDGKTFTHLAIYENDEGQKKHNEIDSFKKFVAELKASQPEIPPKQDILSLVDACYEIF